MAGWSTCARCFALASGSSSRLSTRYCIPLVQPNTSQSRLAHTHFGYQQVDVNEKSAKVHEVFASVAGRYDLMNDLMSAGLHRLWKLTLVRRLAPTGTTRVLDIAGGTGDIALRILEQTCQPRTNSQRSVFDASSTSERVTEAEVAELSHSGETCTSRVVVCDVNESMLQEGRRRAAVTSFTADQLGWLLADAEKLPVASCSYDACTIAFGIRNVTNIHQALSEAFRILKPGGRLLCLEFSHVQNDQLRWLYDRYSEQLIPPMGLLVAGDWNSYQYLIESIRRFPPQEEFCEMMRDAGFRLVSFENLSNGIVAIHSGFKL